ncbi:MAG TPA: hypothetical protein VIM98_02950 [Dyella sp.]|uniref:hypothetical protein n=1 Tax=Dyella sp. TaxID=1869338 RepID=UPI002F925B87
MFKHKVVAISGSFVLIGALAWACGPMFPNQLLDDRAATLKAAPVNSFAFEAARWLPATDSLKPVEADTSAYADNRKVKPDLGIDDAQQAIVDAMGKAADDDAAYAAGAGLPEDVRLYALGALQFHRALNACGRSDDNGPADAASSPAPYGDVPADPASEPRWCLRADRGDLDEAAASFAKVVALPAEQARLRSVWAAYMLGRIHALRALIAAGDAAAFKSERDAAAKAFELARTRAVAGASDTQGLGVASFGEQAQLYLYAGDKRCSWGDFYNASDCARGVTPADLKHAIALYAAQAGHGSNNAVRSLQQIAYTAMQSPDLIKGLVDGPVSQRMLVAYALARGQEGIDSGDAAPAESRPDAALVGLVDAISALPATPVEGTDRLAVLCYRAGRYDLAARLMDKASSPLASWLRAKLALRRGDLAAAASAYAEAAKAFPAANDPKASIQASNTQLILGEQGVLALARGEYIEAMRHLYDASLRQGGDGNEYAYDDSLDPEPSGYGYGNDMRYVAERVLTVDELKAFVDAHAPASPAPAASKDASSNGYAEAPLADHLRWLLARRLMRAGRYDEAFDYFPASGDPRFGDVDLRAKAREYAEDLHQAQRRWTDIGKAEAGYAAAVIAREQGMELLGYEQLPDFLDNDGAYPGGSGQATKSLEQSFVTDGERQRYRDSQAKPDLRFHYRYVAVDRASAAADLLPPRSQAFAAVLCKATGWMLEGPGDGYSDYAEEPPKEASETERERRAKALYRRYVKQGPYVPWATEFGRACPEPDFDKARELKRTQQVRAIEHTIRRHLVWEIAGLALIALAAGGWVVRRRKKAPSA